MFSQNEETFTTKKLVTPNWLELPEIVIFEYLKPEVVEIYKKKVYLRDYMTCG